MSLHAVLRAIARPLLRLAGDHRDVCAASFCWRAADGHGLCRDHALATPVIAGSARFDEFDLAPGTVEYLDPGERIYVLGTGRHPGYLLIDRHGPPT